MISFTVVVSRDGTQWVAILEGALIQAYGDTAAAALRALALVMEAK